MKTPGLFVAGTDTDVGKTRVAAAILRTLRAAGQRVVAYKPVASGFASADDERSSPSSTSRPSARALATGAIAAANDCGHASRGSPRRPAASQSVQASLRSSSADAKPLATGL